MNRVLLDSSSAGAAGGVQGPRLQRLARKFLKRLELDGCELSLSLVKDRQIRAVNKEWRGKDSATDVLSFPAGAMTGPGLRQLGDVVISVETAQRAAAQFESTFERELSLYLAHGLLHLLGYGHDTPSSARKMQRQEVFLLGDRGMLSRSDEVD